MKQYNQNGNSAYALAKKFFEGLNDTRDLRKHEARIPTGYKCVDEMLFGFLPGHLYVIGARPAVGKTAFLINLAVNMLRLQDNPFAALFYTLELNGEQLTRRILSCMSGIQLEKIQSNDFKEQDLQALYERGVLQLANQHLTIVDNQHIHLEDIRMQLRERSPHPFQIVFIDYLQLFYPGKAKCNQEDISETMTGLKNLAMEFKIPIVVTSQLKRTAALRGEENRTPQLQDLPGSGEIEKSADAVILLFRPAYYDVQSDSLAESNKGETHLLLLKNNSGRLGTIQLKALLQVQQFREFNR